ATAAIDAIIATPLPALCLPRSSFPPSLVETELRDQYGQIQFRDARSFAARLLASNRPFRRTAQLSSIPFSIRSFFFSLPNLGLTLLRKIILSRTTSAIHKMRLALLAIIVLSIIW